MRVVRLESIADLLDRHDPRIVVLQPVVIEVAKHGSKDRCSCGRVKHPDARLCVTCMHQRVVEHRSA